MKKLFFVALAVLMTGPLVSFESSPKKGVRPIHTIIIDPGHGGMFPGARGTMSRECDVSLSVALRLGKTIQEQFPDIKVIYTRTTDANSGNKPNLTEDLRNRANLANESGGDLFISIHCNSAGKAPGGWYGKRVTGYTTGVRKVKVKKKWVNKTVRVPIYENYWIENVARGTETYVWAVGKNDAKVSSISKNNEYYGEIDSTSNLTLPDPKDPEEKARMLIYAQNYFRKSLTLADFIEKEFAAGGRVSRGVKQRNDRGIWVLQATGMPSVLVEIGFISNKEEEEYINSESGQEEIISHIIAGFKAYKEKLELKANNSE